MTPPTRAARLLAMLALWSVICGAEAAAVEPTPADQTISDLLVAVGMAEVAAFNEHPCLALDGQAGALFVVYSEAITGRAFAAKCDVWAGSCDSPVDVSARAGLGDFSGLALSCAWASGALLVASQNAGAANMTQLFACSAELDSCAATLVTSEPASGIAPALAIDPDSGTVLVATTNGAGASGGAPALSLCEPEVTSSLSSSGSCVFLDVGRLAGLQSTAQTGHFLSIDVADGWVYLAAVDLGVGSGRKRILLFRCAVDGSQCKYSAITGASLLVSNSTSRFWPRVRATPQATTTRVAVAVTVEDAPVANSMGLFLCTSELECTYTDVTSLTGAGADSGYAPALDVDSSSGVLYLASHEPSGSSDVVTLFTCTAESPPACSVEPQSGLGDGSGSGRVDVLFDQDSWSLITAAMSADGVRARRRAASCDEPGFQLTTTTTCVACPAGSMLDTSTRFAQCVLCPAGSYAPDAGTVDACTECPDESVCPVGSTAPIAGFKATAGAERPDIFRVDEDDFSDPELVQRVFLALGLAIAGFALVFGAALALWYFAVGPELRAKTVGGLLKTDLFFRQAKPQADDGDGDDDEDDDQEADNPDDVETARDSKVEPVTRLRSFFGGYMGVVAMVAVALAIAALSVQLAYDNATLTTSQMLGENALDVPLADRPAPRIRATITLDGVALGDGLCALSSENATTCVEDLVTATGFPADATFAEPMCSAEDGACVVTWECLSGCRLLAAPFVRVSLPGPGYATVVTMLVEVTTQGVEFDARGHGAAVSLVATPTVANGVFQRRDERDTTPFVAAVSVFQRVLLDERDPDDDEPKQTLGFALVEPTLRQRGTEVAAADAAVLPALQPGVPVFELVFVPQAFHEVTTVARKETPVSFMAALGGAVSGVLGIGAVIVKAMDAVQKATGAGLTTLLAKVTCCACCTRREREDDTDEASTGRWDDEGQDGSEGDLADDESTVEGNVAWAASRTNY